MINENTVEPMVQLPQDEPFIIATAEQIQAAFTLWDKRYRENPEKFVSEAYRLLKEDAETYGEQATPYFLSVLEEIAEKQ